MKFKKKCIKLILILIFIVLITFKYDQINSTNEISQLNKLQIYDNSNMLIYECNNLHEGSYISIDEINDFTKNAIIQIEDKNFYNHSGFDIFRIIKLSLQNLFNTSDAGASTITQQYIKNLYFNNNRSYTRKLNEIIYSVRLENLYTKDEILEGYLNTIYFGNNIYGIHDACRYYFNKSPKDINENETAIIVSLIKTPSISYQDLMIRKDEILNIFLNKKLIDTTIFNKYYNYYHEFSYTDYTIYSNGVLYFKDIVIDELSNLDINFNFDEVIKIYTNFDSTIDTQITNFLKTDTTSCNLAALIVDNDGYYINIIGGKNYYKSTYNIAMHANRDIGSTIKPLLYYEALQNNMTTLSTFTSKKQTIYYNNEEYNFKNYNDIYQNDLITMGYALATSDNIYAVKTHLYIGMDKLVNSLNKFNVTAFKTPSLALGNVNMSLDKLVTIYNTFSNLGKYTNNKAIKSIQVNNDLRYINYVTKTQKLDSANCFIINDLMTYMFDTNISSNNSVTGSSITNQIDFKISAKTGLTDYDSYIVGFTPKYTLAIWSGYDNNDLLINTNDKFLPKSLFVTIVNNLNYDSWYNTPSNVYISFADPTFFNTGYKRNIYTKKTP